MSQKYISDEHPTPWSYKEELYDHGNGSGYCYPIYDATGAYLDTIYEEEVAKCLTEFSQAVKRKRDLALMLREMIAEYGSSSKEEGISQETLTKAEKLLDEGNEVSLFDQELNNYLDVFKGLRTRKEIEEEIEKNKNNLRALEWCVNKIDKL